MTETLMADFDAWARLSARLLRHSALECARIIRDAGVEHEWQRADAHWYGQLLQDGEAGRTDRIDRYRLHCVEAIGARRRSGDTVASPLDVLRSQGPSDRGDGTEKARALAARWSVEDYAWLCAELERFPEREDRVWGTRGIVDGESKRTVRSVWDDRLGNEEGLRGRYDELVVVYREMLRRR